MKMKSQILIMIDKIYLNYIIFSKYKYYIHFSFNLLFFLSESYFYAIRASSTISSLGIFYFFY